MKSAYELAMERLEKQSPSAKLTDKQRAEIAEIDKVFRAKIAEKELFLKDEITKAEAAACSMNSTKPKPSVFSSPDSALSRCTSPSRRMN